MPSQARCGDLGPVPTRPDAHSLPFLSVRLPVRRRGGALKTTVGEPTKRSPHSAGRLQGQRGLQCRFVAQRTPLNLDHRRSKPPRIGARHRLSL